MLKTRLPALAVAVAVVVAACASSSDADTTTTIAGGASDATTTEPPGTSATTVPLAGVPTRYDDYLRQATACGGPQPDPVEEMQFTSPEDVGLSGPVDITITTSCGALDITLSADVAPETVNSFVFLAEEGYFDGSVSHRIIPGFMMQAGDPTATGRGGPGYVIADELPASSAAYQRGVVAMANAGPNTGGSQFFILFDEADWLPPSYSVFGFVTGGFETLDAIQAIPLGMSPTGADPSPSVPLASLFIESVVVHR